MTKTCAYSPLLLMLMIAGCTGSGGPERAVVSGAVSFNGEPVEEGTISFVPTGTTQGPSTGSPITAGEYSIAADKGPVLGTHRVEIRAYRKTGRKLPPKPPNPSETEETVPYIPAQYNSESTLTVEIEPGKNEGTNFELKVP